MFENFLKGISLFDNKMCNCVSSYHFDQHTITRTIMVPVGIWDLADIIMTEHTFNKYKLLFNKTTELQYL